MVKDPPTMQVTRVQSLGLEYPLEKEMATHSSILAWRIPWAEESGGLQSIASYRVGHDWSDLVCMHTLIFLHFLVRILYTMKPANIC